MIPTWSLTDFELNVRWRELSGERHLPKPLYFTSRVASEDDYRREVAIVSEQLKGRLDQAFDAALSIMIDPHVRLGIHGFDGRDPRNAAGRIRVAAARTWERCVIIKQTPGETIYHSGGYVVAECESSEWARLLTEQLPDVVAGKRGRVELTGGRDYSYGRSVAGESSDADDYDTIAERCEAFRNTPATTIGRIEILQGSSRFGPRGVSHRLFEWRDLVDDGRYVMDDNGTVAVPANREQLRTMINAGIGVIIGAIEDEPGGGASLRLPAGRSPVTEDSW